MDRLPIPCGTQPQRQPTIFPSRLPEAHPVRRLLRTHRARCLASHAQLTAEATALADLAEADPDAAADVLLGFSADGLLRMILNGACESDRAVYETPEFARRFDGALAEGFADPQHGYVRDTLPALRPWQLRLDAIAAPVDVLFGEHDASHSPDLGATLSRRIARCERVVLRDAGAALLWTHSGEVLERAIR